MNPFQDHTKNLLQDNTIPWLDDDDVDEEHHHSQNLSAQDLDLSLGNIYNSDHSNSSAAAQGAVLDDLGDNPTRNQNLGESNRNQNLSENTRNLQDFDGPALTLAVATNEIEAAGQSGFHQGVDTNETLLLIEKKQIQKDYKSMKATNCHAKSLKIGKYEVNAKNEGDLVAKFYFGHRKIIWEISEGSILKKKIVIRWSEISGIRTDLASGFLQVELDQCPTFGKERDRTPGKITKWEDSDDFTDGNASLYRIHSLNFAPGTLDRHYKNLLSVDKYLLKLSKSPFPTGEVMSRYFTTNTAAAPPPPPPSSRPQNQGNVGVPRQLPIGHPNHNHSAMPAGTMMQMQNAGGLNSTANDALAVGQIQRNLAHTQNPTGAGGIHFTGIPYSQVMNYSMMMMNPGMMMNDPQYHRMMQNHAAAAAGRVMWNSETMENRHLQNPQTREHLAIDAQAAAAGESSMSAGEEQQETGSGSNQNNPTSNAQ